jgi:hypothetical protein
MAATAIRHASISSATSELTLVVPVTQLSVSETPVGLPQSMPLIVDVGEVLKEDAPQTPTDLAPQTVDVGWFELDENVIKGMCFFLAR